jgi:hypothetical protein
MNRRERRMMGWVERRWCMLCLWWCGCCRWKSKEHSKSKIKKQLDKRKIFSQRAKQNNVLAALDESSPVWWRHNLLSPVPLRLMTSQLHSHWVESRLMTSHQFKSHIKSRYSRFLMTSQLILFCVGASIYKICEFRKRDTQNTHSYHRFCGDTSSSSSSSTKQKRDDDDDDWNSPRNKKANKNHQHADPFWSYQKCIVQ